MNIVILGGSLFIGAHLVEYLINEFKDCKIYLVNRGISKTNWNVENKDLKRIFKIYVDRNYYLEFENELSKIANENIDFVVDLSCYYKDELTPAIRAFSKKIKRYIFISTCAVYGNLKYIPADEQHPLDLSEANSMYGREKIRCEQELLNSIKINDFEVTIIRPTYVFGPYDYTKRLFYFIDRIEQDVPILLPGVTDHWFNAIYVKDLVKIITILMLNEFAKNQIYNAASNDSLYFSEFIELIGKCLNKKINMLSLSIEEFKKLNLIDIFPFNRTHVAIDVTKFKKLVGEDNFKFTTYKKAICETIDWYKKSKQIPSKNNYDIEKRYFEQFKI